MKGHDALGGVAFIRVYMFDISSKGEVVKRLLEQEYRGLTL